MVFCSPPLKLLSCVDARCPYVDSNTMKATTARNQHIPVRDGTIIAKLRSKLTFVDIIGGTFARNCTV